MFQKQVKNINLYGTFYLITFVFLLLLSGKTLADEIN